MVKKTIQKMKQAHKLMVLVGSVMVVAFVIVLVQQLKSSAQEVQLASNSCSLTNVCPLLCGIGQGCTPEGTCCDLNGGGGGGGNACDPLAMCPRLIDCIPELGQICPPLPTDGICSCGGDLLACPGDGDCDTNGGGGNDGGGGFCTYSDNTICDTTQASVCMIGAPCSTSCPVACTTQNSCESVGDLRCGSTNGGGGVAQGQEKSCAGILGGQLRAFDWRSRLQAEHQQTLNRIAGNGNSTMQQVQEALNDTLLIADMEAVFQAQRAVDLGNITNELEGADLTRARDIILREYMAAVMLPTQTSWFILTMAQKAIPLPTELCDNANGGGQTSCTCEGILCMLDICYSGMPSDGQCSCSVPGVPNCSYDPDCGNGGGGGGDICAPINCDAGYHFNKQTCSCEPQGGGGGNVQCDIQNQFACMLEPEASPNQCTCDVDGNFCPGDPDCGGGGGGETCLDQSCRFGKIFDKILCRCVNDPTLSLDPIGLVNDFERMLVRSELNRYFETNKPVAIEAASITTTEAAMIDQAIMTAETKITNGIENGVRAGQIVDAIVTPAADAVMEAVSATTDLATQNLIIDTAATNAGKKVGQEVQLANPTATTLEVQAAVTATVTAIKTAGNSAK